MSGDFYSIIEHEPTEIPVATVIVPRTKHKRNKRIKTMKKSNLKLNMLYPIIACMLFTGCDFVEYKDNVVVVPGKNKIVVKDVKDGHERIFFTNKSDNRFQGLNVGDTINVRRRRGYGDYDYYRVFDDDNKYVHIDVNDLHVVREKFRFDSIKNAMLRDSVAQNKR